MCSHGDTSPQTVKCCTHGSGVGGLHQTLDEMSFERGPWYPASNGDYEAIRRYLDKGGDPSVIDTAGYTPLHYAARNGYGNIAEALLGKGASVNAGTKASDSTPLHRACLSGNVSIVRLLLKHRAQPSLADTDGKLPIHVAAGKEFTEVCRLLLECNPECLTVKDKKGKVARDYIKETSSLELRRLLR